MLRSAIIAVFAGSLLCILTASSFAANFTTSITQAAGQNWNAAIWTPQGGGTAVAPTAGNTYTVLSNGIAIFNLSGNARVRNPTAAGVQTFVGDSLTITTNAELRLKAGPSAVNLPGVGGNAGLIMDGGFLNLADNGVFTITGVVQVATSMYIDAVNDHGGPLQPTRGLNLRAKLTGSGTVYILQSSTNTPHTIASDSNTFSGKWVVTSGRLLASGLNSLGTNDITIDPLAPLGLDPSLVIVAGPAVLDINYDINSAGRLTLTNGGLMKLSRNCVFGSAVVEGTSLSSGTHFYSELAANFPSSFLPGGSGSITVQPFGTPPVFVPQFSTQPQPVTLYAGGTAHFTAAAFGPGTLTNIWRRNGVNLSDGGDFSGVTSMSLSVSNVSAANIGDYDVVVANASGYSTSVVATLSLRTPPGTYETAIVTNLPVAYWELNDLTDPNTNGPAFEYVGGLQGIYGSFTQNGLSGILGPQPSDGFPGFFNGNNAALFFHGISGSTISAPALNLNTNTVTITAWVNPSAAEASLNTLVFCRGGGTVAGLRYGAGLDGNGNRTLGYAWNDEAGAANWNSLLAPPQNQWSFLALVITPTNATIYMINTNGLASASQSYVHVPQAFSAATWIGDDANSGGGRTFSGMMDEVAIFKRSFSREEIVNLYAAASGVSSFPPVFTTQPPASPSEYAGRTIQIAAAADGNPAVSFQWQVGTNGVFVDLSNGGQFAGVTNSTLTISNLTSANAGDYILIATNIYGAVTSSVSTLTVIPTGPPLNITLIGQQPSPLDWDTSGWWSDGNPASVSSLSNPGSTYEVLAGGRLRSPYNVVNSSFPGDSLQVDGDGVWQLNNAGTIGELRLKAAGTVGTVYFKKLIMNGGQILQASDNFGNIVALTGEMNVLANAPLFGDVNVDRGFRIDSWLTGSGNIECRLYPSTFNPAFRNGINITGTSNTFSGKWNVIVGTLLGSGTNSLGTNDITVGVDGALEVAYDMNNTNANLIVDGKVYLHQNLAFKNVIVNGTPLAPGNYSFAQLSASYPTNFPASWTQLTGSSFSTASGSIKVGNVVAPVTLSIQQVGSNFQLSWPQGTLLEADDLTGPWVTNNASSPFTITPTQGKKFYRVLVQ